MIKNNKISKFLDQYSNELRRMGIYLLVIAFVFSLSLKIIADRTRLAPPDNGQAEEIGLEVSRPQLAQPKDTLENPPLASNPAKEEPQPATKEEPKVKIPLEKSNLVDGETEARTEEEAKEDTELELNPQQQVNAPEESRPPAHAPTISLDFHWPIQGTVLTPYGFAFSKTFGDYRFNPAIDIQAPAGTEVKAALAGKVINVQTTQRERVVVEIDHGQGFVSRYSHMTQSLVKHGDTVKTGQAIGQIGAPGLDKTEEGPLLNFQIIKDGERLDPQQYLKE